MTIVDQLSLLATSAVALYLVWRFATDYRRLAHQARHDVYYLVSFGTLAGALLVLVAFGYGVLRSPLVIVPSVLIPGVLSLGLVAELLPRYERAYLAFVAIGLLLLALTLLLGEASAATVVVIVISHSTSGTIILVVPVLGALQDAVSWRFVAVTVGGALNDLSALAMAFLMSGVGGITLELQRSATQVVLLTDATVLAALAPLLLLMTLAFALGLTAPRSARDRQTQARDTAGSRVRPAPGA